MWIAVDVVFAAHKEVFRLKDNLVETIRTRGDVVTAANNLNEALMHESTQTRDMARQWKEYIDANPMQPKAEWLDAQRYWDGEVAKATGRRTAFLNNARTISGLEAWAPTEVAKMAAEQPVVCSLRKLNALGLGNGCEVTWRSRDLRRRLAHFPRQEAQGARLARRAPVESPRSRVEAAGAQGRTSSHWCRVG